MKAVIGLISFVILATVAYAALAQNAGGDTWSRAPAVSGMSQPAASGFDVVRQQHGYPGDLSVHGRGAWTERGETKPGTTVYSAEQYGAAPVGITPPVPAPTVGATGGRVPHAR